MARLRKISGKYFLYFYDPNRTPKEKSVPLRTGLKSAAEKHKTRLENEYGAGKFDPWNPVEAPRSVTVKEAAQRFLASRVYLRPLSQRTYADVLRWLGSRLPPNLMLKDLSEAHLAPFIHDGSVSRASQRKRFTNVRVFLKWCLKTGLLEKNPLENVSHPKEQTKVPEYLTQKELDRLITAIEVDYRMKAEAGRAYEGQILWLKDAVLLAVSTGMRRGELLALRWGDICFETNTITIRNRDGFTTKSGSERTIPLVKPAREVLERLDAQRKDDLDGPVLTGQNGGPLYPNLLTRRFKYYCRLAKLDERFSIHSLRHTTASWLLQKGYSLEIVGAILGHGDVRTTRIYAHLAPHTLASAMHSTFD